MKKIFFTIRVFVIVLILTGCSSQWHLEKAIKKDPSIQAEITDTLTFTRIIRDTIHTSDSTYYIEERLTHFDTVLTYLQVKQVVCEKKTRYQIKQEEKTKRYKIKHETRKAKKQIKQSEKTNRVEIRQDAKTERRSSWWWIWMSVGIIIGLFIRKIFETTMSNLKM